MTNATTTGTVVAGMVSATVRVGRGASGAASPVTRATPRATMVVARGAAAAVMTLAATAMAIDVRRARLPSCWALVLKYEGRSRR